MISLPFTFNYQGKRLCLIDTVVELGSSGSPVFLKTPDLNQNTNGSLLGVLTNLPEINYTDDGLEEVVESPNSRSQMGTIVKMDIVIEAITAYLKEKGFI